VTNLGLIAGDRRGTWVNFEPPIQAAGNGTVTQPGTVASTTSRCRHLFLPPGLVIAQYQVGLGLGASPGAGDAYVLELPYRARRMNPLGYPHVIGQCMPYKTVTATPPETFAVATLADPWLSLGGAEDRYCQFYIQNITGGGTGTWASGTATTTVTHGLGIAPSAYDIEFNVTNMSPASGVDAMFYVIDNITTTTFDVSTPHLQNLSSVNATYFWRVRTEPRSGTTGSWLVGPNRPWVSSFDSFFFEIMYERA
jgi:hypothetical protein